MHATNYLYSHVHTVQMDGYLVVLSFSFSCGFTLNLTLYISIKQEDNLKRYNIVKTYIQERRFLLVLQSVAKPLYRANIDFLQETSRKPVSSGESL